jgi:hypothetical protein
VKLLAALADAKDVFAAREAPQHAALRQQIQLGWAQVCA